MDTDLEQVPMMAVIELETKLHFDRDHVGARALTQTACDSAGASVDAVGHLPPSIVHRSLLFRIGGVERRFADLRAQG